MLNDGKVLLSLMGGKKKKPTRVNIAANSPTDGNESMQHLKMTYIRTVRAVSTCWCKVRGPANWTAENGRERKGGRADLTHKKLAKA